MSMAHNCEMLMDDDQGGGVTVWMTVLCFFLKKAPANSCVAVTSAAVG